MSPDVNLLGTYLDRLSMLSLEGPFRAQLANVGVSVEDPRAFAIATACMLMAEVGSPQYEVAYVAAALRDLTAAELAEAVVFIENGSVLGIPRGEGNMLVDRGSLQEINPDERAPSIVVQVWYLGPLIDAAVKTFEDNKA